MSNTITRKELVERINKRRENDGKNPLSLPGENELAQLGRHHVTDVSECGETRVFDIEQFARDNYPGMIAADETVAPQ